ncbi:hypothetical protein Gogos_011684 [Gossypium gossypioides]|uniref:Uncharacterized protein n=1 Tax=Gossypium gossypioides TaxID=34282 RepID=A0A7J9BQF8_GOSGO|nr:hypothetical protein [Gossypium gossypioides]
MHVEGLPTSINFLTVEASNFEIKLVVIQMVAKLRLISLSLSGGVADWLGWCQIGSFYIRLRESIKGNLDIATNGPLLSKSSKEVVDVITALVAKVVALRRDVNEKIGVSRKQLKNNLFSSTYNPRWRYYANFAWGNNQNKFSQARLVGPLELPQNQYQRSLLQQPQVGEKKAATKELFQQFIQITDPPPNANNLKEHCKVVSLKSGKEILNTSLSIKVNLENQMHIPPISKSFDEVEENSKEKIYYETESRKPSKEVIKPEYSPPPFP